MDFLALLDNPVNLIFGLAFAVIWICGDDLALLFLLIVSFSRQAAEAEKAAAPRVKTGHALTGRYGRHS